MKKHFIIIFLVLTLLSGCSFAKEEKMNLGNFKYTILKDCSNKKKLYYENIYLYCIDNIYFLHNDIEQELKNYLKESGKKIDSLIEDMYLEKTLWDGGTKIYRGKNKTKNDVTIIYCNKINNDGKYNTNIYIGKNDLIYDSSICD